MTRRDPQFDADMNDVFQLPERQNPAYPPDYYGPHVPVRAALYDQARVSPCHRCERTTIVDAVHLVDADGTPLCAACTTTIGAGVARGLRALNALAHALQWPGAQPDRALIGEWAEAKVTAGPDGAPLLQAAAQLLADHVGYQASAGANWQIGVGA